MSNNGDDDEVAAAGSIVADRSCIGCDKCGVGSPQKCCARCGLFYYCSKECQVQHWKQHKSICTLIKKRYNEWKEGISLTLPDGTALDTKEGPCAICLEETITNPVVMPCGHVFCFACMGSYQSSSDSEDALCPYCRGEIPDVWMRAAERAQLYSERAVASSKGSEEQQKYAKLAILEHDSLMVISHNEEMQMMILHTKAMMTSMAGQPEKAIKITDEVLLFNEKYPGILDLDQVVLAKHWKAQAYSDCGKCKDSAKMYRSLIGEHKQRGEFPSGMILTDYSRVLYELQKYEEAILVGNMVIELNRSCPGGHKYVALSQKVKGDIDAAAKTMSRAILYEEHWDKDNMQRNKELLRELHNL